MKTPPKLFAQVAVRINSLELQAPPPRAKLGEEVIFNFLVTDANEWRSVAKVVVTDAAGRVVSIYGGNRDLVNGTGRLQFRTTLNDPKGVWRVAITEVISGEAASAEITIQ